MKRKYLPWFLAAVLLVSASCGSQNQNRQPLENSIEPPILEEVPDTAVTPSEEATPAVDTEEQWAASQAAWDGTAGGALTMDEAAAVLAEQVAAFYLALPDWVEYRPADMQVAQVDIFDAYYGEPANFCCTMEFYISLTSEDPGTLARSYWETGAGLSGPISTGPYSGCYTWGAEVRVEKNEAGDWYCADYGTGGYTVKFPYTLSSGLENSLENAPLEGLVEQMTLTAGWTHDWIIPKHILAKPLDTLAGLSDILDGYSPEEAENVCRALAELFSNVGYDPSEGVSQEELRGVMAAQYQEYFE